MVCVDAPSVSAAALLMHAQAIPSRRCRIMVNGQSGKLNGSYGSSSPPFDSSWLVSSYFSPNRDSEDTIKPRPSQPNEKIRSVPPPLPVLLVLSAVVHTPSKSSPPPPTPLHLPHHHHPPPFAP